MSRASRLIIAAVATILATGIQASQGPQNQGAPDSTDHNGNAKPCVLVIKKPVNNDPRTQFPQAMIEMALSKTEREYGPCRLETKEAGTSERLLKQVQAGEFDIAWFVATKEREAALLPIRIPVYQGLHGYRILVIRKADQDKFDHVKTIADLRRLVAGQVSDWHFSDVLKFNDLPVDTAGGYEDLYPMLARGRFDYLPRAVHEPISEMKRYANLPLVIEPHLMIYHMVPDYFFVRKASTELAERLRLGLERGIADGTRDRLRDKLLDLPALRRNLQLDKRRILEVRSLETLEQVPADRKEFWLRLHTVKS